ncbi:ATP-binding protein [Streptomyces sp. NPDC086023]|uniref:ATP-binding protein n=1 Tax=Streptomyces sp. NPDC086023 TaxID=3365746 RepID=UPI0037D5DCC3
MSDVDPYPGPPAAARPGEQTRRLVLRGTRGVVTRCRDFTREALADWHWIPSVDGPAYADLPPEQEERWAVVEDVLLLVSEVVTNACMHAGGPSELVLHHTPERLRVEVTDGSPEVPRLRPAGDPAQPGGHGLVVLQRLAREWGWRPVGSGKTVWLEVPSPLRYGEDGHRSPGDHGQDLRGPGPHPDGDGRGGGAPGLTGRRPGAAGHPSADRNAARPASG